MFPAGRFAKPAIVALLTGTVASHGAESYRLERASRYLFNCPCCLVEEIAFLGGEAVGSFRLEEIDRPADGSIVHALEDFVFVVVGDFSKRRFTAEGLYVQRPGANPTQSLDLSVSVNGTLVGLFTSGEVPLSAPEPRLEISVRYLWDWCGIFEDVSIVASPGLPLVWFRRGDANADGAEDISDAVHILLWLFAGGSPSDCLEAANANGDAKIDLSDSIYLLAHLFVGGSPPPEPGPTSCFPLRQPLGCQAFPPCDG